MDALLLQEAARAEAVARLQEAGWMPRVLVDPKVRIFGSGAFELVVERVPNAPEEARSPIEAWRARDAALASERAAKDGTRGSFSRGSCGHASRGCERAVHITCRKRPSLNFASKGSSWWSASISASSRSMVEWGTSVRIFSIQCSEDSRWWPEAARLQATLKHSNVLSRN